MGNSPPFAAFTLAVRELTPARDDQRANGGQIPRAASILSRLLVVAPVARRALAAGYHVYFGPDDQIHLEKSGCVGDSRAI